MILPLTLWLQQIQRQAGRPQEFEFSKLSDIQLWSEVARGQPLSRRWWYLKTTRAMNPCTNALAAWRLAPFQFEERTNNPLTWPPYRAGNHLKVLYDASRFEKETIGRA